MSAKDELDKTFGCAAQLLNISSAITGLAFGGMQVRHLCPVMSSQALPEKTHHPRLKSCLHHLDHCMAARTRSSAVGLDSQRIPGL